MSIMQAPRTHRASVAPSITRKGTRKRFGEFPVTITKPNGEVIVLAPNKVKVAKVKPRNKRKPKRVKANRATRTIKRQTLEQDNKWIELQERKQATLRALGSIHADDN